jgi:hypothetical protein
MTITFEWAAIQRTLTNPALQQPAEETMKNLVAAKPEHFNSCHDGPLLVTFLDTNEVETLLTGRIACQCSKAIATFSLGTRTGNIKIQFTR